MRVGKADHCKADEGVVRHQGAEGDWMRWPTRRKPVGSLDSLRQYEGPTRTPWERDESP